MSSTSPTDLKAMKAWIYNSTSGGLQNNIKSVDDAALPFKQPFPDDGILVKVHYSALNPADYKFPELGLVGRAVMPTPASPGLDYSGVIAQLGSAVEGFKVGDKVFGRITPNRFGTLSEYVLARVSGCAVLPEGVSLQDASCIGTAGQTAYQCIVPNVQKGDKIFINGGSGGTGTFGIQIAKAIGCYVTTSCSGKNADFCRNLGADGVIDYTTENVSEVLKSKGQVYKLVVDNVGSTPTDLHKAADHFLLPDGKFVQIGGQFTLADINTILSRRFLPSFLGGGKRKWEYLVTEDKHEQLEQIGKWMQEGKVKAAIDEVFQYEDVPKAFEKLRQGRVKGKIVVKGSV
ncbi:reticulon-4-interacting protein 1, mitochondrial precursor [Hypoxylon trugodes]|uniref:reticulon-4-interacting protein 1, mitochondrial precursor n=1 Tax=Hypoxylon trugodes TaxID=326681 RepID=UPI002197568C|nr:reticulon-4-interacting protein 1, mitochondrial precursor [Hypoxylon trugodes]KAI1384348.1 reticulon-4-interacting protein 1, mitochondrial precursor [Hypoxylon trugodes]